MMMPPLPILAVLGFVALYVAVRTVTTFKVRGLAREGIKLQTEFLTVADDREKRALRAMHLGALSPFSHFIYAVMAFFAPLFALGIFAISLFRKITGRPSLIARPQAALDWLDSITLKRLGFERSSLDNWDSPTRRSLSLLITKMAILRSPLAITIWLLYSLVMSPIFFGLVIGSILRGSAKGPFSTFGSSVDQFMSLTSRLPVVARASVWHH